jgi:hypothetical protein
MNQSKTRIVSTSILLAAFFCSLISMAQTFEEFQQQIEEEYNAFEKKTQQRFDLFVEQIDQDFADFLEKSFASFDLTAGNKPPVGPKPNNAPSYEPAEKMPSGNIVPKDGIKDEKPFVVRLPNVKKQEPEEFQTQQASFSFFGASLKLNYHPPLQSIHIGGIHPEGISQYWLDMSDTYYNHLISQLDDVKAQLNLNDWGYYLLIKAFAAELHPQNGTARSALSWYLLTRSRYKAKVAYSENRLYLLLPFMQELYGRNYITDNGIRYYLLEETLAQLHTFQGDFPESDIIINLHVSRALNLPEDLGWKKISFNFNQEAVSLEVPYNKHLMRFYETIPMTDVAVYFDAKVWPATREAFRLALMPRLEKLGQSESIHLLLTLVQSGFEYRTDEAQFGYERYFFADELLHYPYSDCEDRAVLFAYLVRELLQIDVIGLALEGHMATGVCLETHPGGQFVDYNNCRYTIADPTFVNAPPGLMMAEYRNQQPEVIPINSGRGPSERIWELARQAGAYRADRQQDVVFDKQGNAYIAGYILETVDFGGHMLRAQANARNSFVASYTADGLVRWARVFSSVYDNQAFGLALNKQGNLLVAGSFEGAIAFGEDVLRASPNPDMFLAQFTADGKLLWATKAGLDGLDQQASFMFVVAFNPGGDKWLARLFSETEDFMHYGLSLDSLDNAYLTGSFYATTGMNSTTAKSFDSGSGFNVVNSLKAENDALINDQYERTIAGLFAAMQLMQINALELPGEAVQQTFDKHNPAFVSVAPKFYSSFGGLRFIKNAGGIITIKTTDGKAVVFDKIKVDDNARIKVITYKSGNARVEVFSGIQIAGPKLSYPLNEVKLYRESGDLLLDYDTDNSQVKLNLRRDMLKL